MLAEAKAVWPHDAINIEVSWSLYSTHQCHGDCYNDCLYQSGTYTSGHGWYTVYTEVLLTDDKPVLVCPSVK